MKMHFALAPPRSIVDEIMGISKIQSEKHQIVLEIAEDLPTLLLDKEKMKEVVINLVSNAIKYSPAGGKVWVRMRQEDHNLRIEVQDQGIGISREHQEKLFQAFSRVDASDAAGIPGTGLGLVIAKAIVEHHDGKIGFESEANRGSTFFILIPIRKEIRKGEAGSELGSLAE
jgi:signal transduction histidine kinase